MTTDPREHGELVDETMAWILLGLTQDDPVIENPEAVIDGLAAHGVLSVVEVISERHGCPERMVDRAGLERIIGREVPRWARRGSEITGPGFEDFPDEFADDEPDEVSG